MYTGKVNSISVLILTHAQNRTFIFQVMLNNSIIILHDFSCNSFTNQYYFKYDNLSHRFLSLCTIFENVKFFCVVLFSIILLKPKTQLVLIFLHIYGASI